jgi:hypothetical protein
MIGLLTGIWGGLARLGWTSPAPPAALVAAHGPLMVSGFLGTVIGLERAVALGKGWGYLAPLATGLGTLALLAGAPPPAPAMLSTAGSAVVVVIFAWVLRHHLALHMAVMALGAVVWLLAQLAWLGGAPFHRVALWWAAFLVLTIAGERLELARVLRPSPAARLGFLVAVALLMAGLVLGVLAPDAGTRVVGLGFVALTAWLARHDIARRTVRADGLTQFIAVCLLSGYAWLAVGGALALVHGAVPAGGHYDALLHTIFLGFVFAMIFGHAPIIFPAVVGLPVAYRATFYLHLGLLHAGLAIRVVGDLLPWPSARLWGGGLNALAILLFLGATVHGILVPRRPT